MASAIEDTAASVLGTVGRIAAGLTILVAGVAIVCWAVGSIATDRWLGTQFLWWVPWMMYTGACVPAAMAAWLLPRGRLRAAARGATLGGVVIAGFGAAGDVGLGAVGARDRPPGILRIAQWNASWPDARTSAVPSERLMSLDADVVVVSNPFRLFANDRLEAWRAAGYEIRDFRSFAVASRVPILDARLLYASKDESALTCTIDARDAAGGPLSLLVLDLPSNPRLHRMEVARTCRARLAEAGAPVPDIVLGDLNITRGSASLEVLAPSMQDAWSSAGRGWAGSWPLPVPIFQLDHVLLAPSLAAVHCHFLDPGVKRHRAQCVDISMAPQS